MAATSLIGRQSVILRPRMQRRGEPSANGKGKWSNTDRAEGPVLIDAAVTVDIEDHQPEQEWAANEVAPPATTRHPARKNRQQRTPTDQTKTGPSLPALGPGGSH